MCLWTLRKRERKWYVRKHGNSVVKPSAGNPWGPTLHHAEMGNGEAGAPHPPRDPAVRGEKEDAQTEGSMDSRESSMLRHSECPAQRETISPQKRVGGVKDQDHS